MNNEKKQVAPPQPDYNDNTPMPFGKEHKGKALANVPAEYLLYFYDKGSLYGKLKKYCEENEAVLRAQAKRSNERR